MRLAALFTVVTIGLASGAEKTLLWRNPGPVESLDLANGTGGGTTAPRAPFRFVEEVGEGITPKVVVTDARGQKWMVKFGEEAKPETFASRIAWAAGYPVAASWYVRSGKIDGATSVQRAAQFIQPDGTFRGAHFQKFYGEGFRQIPGGKLNLQDRRDDERQLNGLKLTLLLVANWDVKPANTGVFEIDGKHYAVVNDWGASMGDPSAANPADRKWSCDAYAQRTKTLLDGVEDGYLYFNYQQYAARHERAISEGIRLDDLKWYLGRMSRLSDSQIRAALNASGATPAESECFTKAVRERLNLFARASRGEGPAPVRTRTIRKTITTTVK